MKLFKSLYKKYPLLKAIFTPFLITSFILLVIFGIKYKHNVNPINNTKSTVSNNSTTTSWKTYSSETYQFSFQYPKDWVLKESPDYSIKFWVCASCESYGGPTEPGVTCNPDYNLGSVCVSISNAKDFDEIVSNKIYTENEKVSFIGNEAVRVVYPGGPSAGGSYLITFVKHKMRIYETNLTRIYEINLTYRNLFNIEKLSNFPYPRPDILSTFKFLD